MINTVKSNKSNGMIPIEFFSSHIFASYERLYNYLCLLPNSNGDIARTIIHYLYKANSNTYYDIQHINTKLHSNTWTVCIGIYDIDSFNKMNLVRPYFKEVIDEDGKSMIIMKVSLPYVKLQENAYKVVTINFSELEIKLNQFNEQGYKIISVTNNGRDIDNYNVVIFKNN